MSEIIKGHKIPKKNTVKCINHSSLLITNNEGKSILTDPWFISSAFSTWYQYPYPYSDSVFDLTRKNKDISNDFVILISHGHDDHCDDFIIKHHFREKKVLVPKFKTNGLQKRIKKNTGHYPYELFDEAFDINGFIVTNHINSNYSLYDAIQIIRFDDIAIIHANDNWHEYPNSLAEQMKKNLQGIDIEKRYYFVQFGIADSFPMNYLQYSLKEMKKIVLSRFNNFKQQTEANLKKLNCGNGFYYANQSSYQYKIDIPYGTTYDWAQNFVKDSPNFIQCQPGMSIELYSGKVTLSPKTIDILSFCIEAIKLDLNIYTKSKWKINLITELNRKNINDNEITIIADNNVWNDIICGKINLESIIVGGNGIIFKPDENISTIHHKICKRSYFYQTMAQENGINFFRDLMYQNK